VTPTQRARAECKRNGWHSAIVERWNPHAHIRQDLFGFIDMLVLDGLPGVLAVQVTSGDHVAERIAKILSSPYLVPWLASGSRVEVWGYRKVGARGKRKLWALRRVAVAAPEAAAA
jgi:hypothetical protein